MREFPYSRHETPDVYVAVPRHEWTPVPPLQDWPGYVTANAELNTVVGAAAIAIGWDEAVKAFDERERVVDA